MYVFRPNKRTDAALTKLDELRARFESQSLDPSWVTRVGHDIEAEAVSGSLALARQTT